MRNKALAILAMTLVLATGAWASSETVLYNFFSQGGDGYYPYAGVVADKSGNLYGTTYSGGANPPYGAVFELTPSGNGWTETVLYSFSAVNNDGNRPYGGLVLDKSGNLYGTTYYGGAFGYGTVFELKRSGKTWKESVLYSFAAGADGAHPATGLVFDASGKLYGTTYQGGTSNRGTAFQLKLAKNGTWTETVMWSFAGGADGSNPLYGALIIGKGGYFYGTTYVGGGSYNLGTVYELFQARGVWVEKVIHSFTGGKQGAYPYGGVTLDPTGHLYGTTYQGGLNNYGIVYRLTLAKNKKWNESVLYSFAAGASDGAYPYASVTLDTKGNIYGTTYQGGQSNVGIVFELKHANGKYVESALHIFGSGDGSNPRGGVIRNSKGQLLGTTSVGGTKNGGVVFEVTP
jgi:uncharacterized repeat protein (TIGR03803 family)